MKNAILMSGLLCCVLAQGQRASTIRDTRVGGVRPDTIQREHQTEDPTLRTEIAATSKETGISRGKLLKQFYADQQKYADMINKKPTFLATTQASGQTPTLTVQQFHVLKVASVKNPGLSEDTLLALTLLHHGDVNAAVREYLRSDSEILHFDAATTPAGQTDPSATAPDASAFKSGTRPSSISPSGASPASAGTPTRPPR